jgi:hypothetical protein
VSSVQIDSSRTQILHLFQRVKRWEYRLTMWWALLFMCVYSKTYDTHTQEKVSGFWNHVWLQWRFCLFHRRRMEKGFSLFGILLPTPPLSPDGCNNSQKHSLTCNLKPIRNGNSISILFISSLLTPPTLA